MAPKLSFCLSLAGLGLTASAAGATGVSFIDPGFELPAVQAGSFTNYAAGDVLDGVWTVGGDDVSLVSRTYSAGRVTYNAHSGQQSLNLAGLGAEAGASGSVSYHLTIKPGLLYHFSFWLGDAPTSVDPAGATVEEQYYIGGVCVAGCGAVPLSATNSATTAGGIDWAQIPNAFEFSSSYFGGKPSVGLDIVFLNDTGDVTGAPDGYTGLDDFSHAVLPEPAAWAMMLLGMGGLGATLRTMRRRPAMALFGG